MAQCIAKLLCNYDDRNSDIDQILSHLESSIEKIVNEIQELPSQPDEKLTLYGPYLGRALMELATTAMLAKLDPLRILITKGRQTQPDYELERPQKASLKWQGDVMGEQVPNLWDDKSLNNPTRAILGRYSVELVLTKSAQNLLDEVTEDAVGEWHQDLTSLEAKPLVMKMITQLSSLYSTLSKGIHHELLIPIDSVLDRDTVVSRLNETIFVVATLGLIVSFVPHAYARNDVSTNFSLYKSAKELEVN
ncbi:hypothetical protein [Vreelandella sp. TE19]